MAGANSLRDGPPTANEVVRRVLHLDVLGHAERRERTAAHYAQSLLRNGFRNARMVPITLPGSIVEAVEA